jgi:hypothetical protein
MAKVLYRGAVAIPLPPLHVRATRLRAFQVAVIVLGASMAAAFAVFDRTDVPVDVGLLVAGAGFVALALMLILGWFSGALRRGYDLLVTPGAMVAPHTSGAFVAGLVGALCGGLGPFLGMSFRARWHSLEIAMGAAMVVVIGALALATSRGANRARLTPSGVDMPRSTGVLHLPWTALRAASPSALNANTVEVWIAEPSLVTWPRWAFLKRRELRCRPSLVRADFLVAAIRYYIEHPDQQISIGEADNYERMRAEVAQTPFPPVEREFTLSSWKTE